jgi:hypothetical protein
MPIEIHLVAGVVTIAIDVTAEIQTIVLASALIQRQRRILWERKANLQDLLNDT